MKNRLTFGISIVTLLFITMSCEKVIDFDLKDTEPVPVAEAVINSMQHSASLKLSYTDNYYDTTGFTPISHAEAVITTASGDSYKLDEVNPGYYINTQIPVNEGEQYNLKLDLQGETYKAVSEMAEPVTIDSVYYIYNAASLFAPEGYRIWAVFRDPPLQENYFRLKLYVNDVDVTHGVIYLWSDANADGSVVQFIFYRHALAAGDRFRVELWGIDKATYDYLFTLQNISTGAQNASLAAPANPETNLSGGNILGYFTAAAVTSTENVTIVQK